MIVVIFPVTILGFKMPHTISKHLGMQMFNFDKVNFSSLTAIEAPPPRFGPGRGVGGALDTLHF